MPGRRAPRFVISGKGHALCPAVFRASHDWDFCFLCVADRNEEDSRDLDDPDLYRSQTCLACHDPGLGTQAREMLYVLVVEDRRGAQRNNWEYMYPYSEQRACQGVAVSEVDDCQVEGEEDVTFRWHKRVDGMHVSRALSAKQGVSKSGHRSRAGEDGHRDVLVAIRLSDLGRVVAWHGRKH